MCIRDRYYTLLQEAKQLPAGYAFLALNVLRTLRDRVAAMAAVSGHQLWNCLLYTSRCV